MKRRIFNKKLLFTAVGISFVNKLFAEDFYLPNDELIGIKKPFLSGTNYKLLPEAFEAFEKMRKSAEKDGLRLWGTSAYRGFVGQQKIWDDKFKKIKVVNPELSDENIISKIIEYTSLPGTSRHHWGTDIDIVDAFGYNNDDPLLFENFEPKGDYQYLNYWLTKFASDFGFYQVYTNQNMRTGFKHEPWHYSYLPFSKKIIHQVCDYDFVTICKIKKVLGYQSLSKSFLDEYIEKYLFGINPILI